MCWDANVPGFDDYGCRTLQQCTGGWVARCIAEEMSTKTWLGHSTSEKRSPLSNHDTLLVWTGKQWGSLSFFFHIPTTHPQKNMLSSGKLLARQFLKGVCACLVPG